MKKNALVKKKHKKSRAIGTSNLPRLYVFRSNQHIYAQLIDDRNGYTLLTVSSLDATIKSLLSSTASCYAAKKVGTLIAEKTLSKGIKSVVFDRGKYLYHGRVKTLADSARQVGLKF
uniref:Large ribosomal subunit protein uL18c n=1 Tax=Sciadococcus taiwanensis TaxID=3028030 RepID=A0A9Y1MWV3_9RHOD|nr:ribosomal protein L18 [Sciadococcus taiwanensis]